MNPLPKENNFDNPAPIPHQSVMKVYGDTWLYVAEKFGNVGFIEVYREVLRNENGSFPTIPGFIYIENPFRTYIAEVPYPVLPKPQKKPDGNSPSGQWYQIFPTFLRL